MCLQPRLACPGVGSNQVAPLYSVYLLYKIVIITSVIQNERTYRVQPQKHKAKVQDLNSVLLGQGNCQLKMNGAFS